jgi:hypothetical protein
MKFYAFGDIHPYTFSYATYINHGKEVFIMSYCAPYVGFGFSSIAFVLVLFILLVIVLRTCGFVW